MAETAASMGDQLVLCYHAVSDDWPAALAVTPERLEEQVLFLVRRGYSARTFSDLVREDGPARSFAITFDDAYCSVFERAFPLLRALDVPATVFVPTALVDSSVPMSWPGIEQWLDSPYAAELTGMSWAQLVELADAGWEIGSHTRSHARLTELDEGELAAELQGSRLDCERRVGRPCRSLAYPYGAVDGRVVRAAREAGFVAAGAPPNRLPGERKLRWPRVGVYPGDDLRRFRLKVSPTIRWLQASRAWTPIGRFSGLV